MVRPINTEEIKNICEEVALNNGGLLYLRGHRDRIKEEYSASDASGRKYKSKISQSHIQEVLVSWVEESSVRHIRDEEVFFVNPFGSKENESQRLYNILTDIFEKQRYVSTKELEDHFRSSNIEIAEDDVEEYISVLESRDLVEAVRGATTFYKPDDELEENYDFLSLEDSLENASKSDGCLTHSQLEEFLGISVVDEIKNDLISNEGALIELEDKYLVNTDECKDQYIDSLAGSELRRDIELEFENNHYALPKNEIKYLVESHFKSKVDLTKIDANQELVNQSVNNIIESFNTNETYVTDEHDNRVKIYELNEDNKFNDNILNESQTIIQDVEAEIGNGSVGSFQYVVDNKIKPKIGQYTTNPEIDDHISKKILNKAEELLDESDSIPATKEL